VSKRKPLDDGKHKAELKRGQQALEIAQMLLRRRAGVSTEFNRARSSLFAAFAQFRELLLLGDSMESPYRIS
jgi:hypothetical protein